MKQQKTALLTGASGGIGRELARELCRRGFNLVLTARDRERLERLATALRRAYGAEVTVIPADLSDSGAPGRLYHQLGEQGVIIDLLVNNAGYGVGGPFAQNDAEEQQRMLQVNIQSLTRLCRLYLPEMIGRRRGRILNIASTGAYLPGPNNAIYCASKAYVLSLSEALAWECRGSGVVVTAVCPGATHSGFAGRAGLGDTPLFRHLVLPPEQVAHTAVEAVLQGRRLVTVGAVNKLIPLALRLAPRVLGTAISGWTQSPKVGRRGR